MAYEGGLRKWFKEDWRDVKTGKKCGRSERKIRVDHILRADLRR